VSARSLSDFGPVVLIGAGKMGLALARGWLAGGLPPDRLVLVDPAPGEATKAFASAGGVRLKDSPAGVLVDVLVLAVKPQIIAEVMLQVRPSVGSHTLVLSIAAGVGLSTLAYGLGTQRVVRSMPNTPAQVGKGISGAVAAPRVGEDDRHVVDVLLGAAGKVVWFEAEEELDAVTAVSGSGPAYVFHLVEALAEAGKRQGIEPEAAMMLARQTVIGAAALLEEDPASAATLRENVTSPNGTTAAALSVLMGRGGLTDLMDRAVAAARLRSVELGRRS
jgi:pyrroline-5-carboxylate reductase